jgi:hypothetical protein
VDAETFSETAKSNRVWWTPEDDQLPDMDETPFDVDLSGLPINEKYTIGETTRRGDFFVVKAATDKSGKQVSVKVRIGLKMDMCAREPNITRRGRA